MVTRLAHNQKSPVRIRYPDHGITSRLITMKYQVGQPFQKVGGDYTFKGVIVAAFTKKTGEVRYVGENSDGLLFIFNEASIQPYMRRILVNTKEHWVEPLYLTYRQLVDIAGKSGFPSVMWHKIKSHEGGTLLPEEAFTFGIDNNETVAFNVMHT